MKKMIILFILIFVIFLWYQILFGLLIFKIYSIDNSIYNISISNVDQMDNFKKKLNLDFSKNFLFFKNLVLSVYSIFIIFVLVFSMIFPFFIDFKNIKGKFQKQINYNILFILTFVLIFLSTFLSIIILTIYYPGKYFYEFTQKSIWIYLFLVILLLFSNYLFYWIKVKNQKVK